MPTPRLAAAVATTPAARLARAGATAGSVVFAAALTGAAAQVSVTLPGTVIPFTLQPVAVLLAGAVLGSRLGALSQAMYLLAGVAGASMFAWSPVLLPGIARLLGPTGGFLLAFPLAAFVTGLRVERAATVRATGVALSLAAGAGVLYAAGAAWVLVLMPGTTGVASATAFAPYAAADLIKLLAVAPAVPALRRVLGR